MSNITTSNPKGIVTALKILLAFGQSYGFIQFHSGDFNIYVPPSYTTIYNFYVDDFAVIHFQQDISVTASLTPGIYDTNQTTDVYLSQSLIVCGFGAIGNQTIRPTTLQCTSMPVTTSLVCTNAFNI